MTYCEGTLEIMSPSEEHEIQKTMIARLIEYYALAHAIPLNGYGSTTFKREAKERGVEPDECYRIGAPLAGGFPDIVIEVIHASPLLDKLTVYDGFAIPEVWIFENGAFAIYRHKKSGGYTRAKRSAFLPKLDLTMVARFVVRRDQLAAMQEFVAKVAPQKKTRRKK